MGRIVAIWRVWHRSRGHRWVSKVRVERVHRRNALPQAMWPGCCALIFIRLAVAIGDFWWDSICWNSCCCVEMIRCWRILVCCSWWLVRASESYRHLIFLLPIVPWQRLHWPTLEHGVDRAPRSVLQMHICAWLESVDDFRLDTSLQAS